MSANELDPSAHDRYRPSGHVDRVAFFGLIAVAGAIAFVMGYLLYLLEEDFYYFFITPVYLVLPVFAAIWAVVRLGHCRNPRLAALMGGMITLSFFAACWEISYRANVLARGDAATAAVRGTGRAPGRLGYVVYRWSTLKVEFRPPFNPERERNSTDRFFVPFLSIAELLAITSCGALVGAFAAKRVYYEGAHRWATTVELLLPADELPTFIRAMNESSWDTIRAIPRIAERGDARFPIRFFRTRTRCAMAQIPCFYVRFEYLESSHHEPVYLTLMIVHVPLKVTRVAKALLKFKPSGDTYFKQERLPASAAHALRTSI